MAEEGEEDRFVGVGADGAGEGLAAFALVFAGCGAIVTKRPIPRRARLGRRSAMALTDPSSAARRMVGPSRTAMDRAPN